jgi:hypothetical protein
MRGTQSLFGPHRASRSSTAQRLHVGSRGRFTTEAFKGPFSSAHPGVVSQHRRQNARVKRPVQWLRRQIEVTACSYLCHSWVFVQAHSLESCVCENGSVSGECGGRSGRVPLAQTLY